MIEHLFFQLYGSFQSWGSVAIGEDRMSWHQPSKSAIMGLVAAAFGIRRNQEELHSILNHNFGFAVRSDNDGSFLRDFHTIQTLPETKIKKNNSIRTRRDELLIKKDLYTILSQRDYICDAFFSVCIWQNIETPNYSLKNIQTALKEPVFTLYLGRKANPPALPLNPLIINAITLKEAFEKYHPDILFKEAFEKYHPDIDGFTSFFDKKHNASILWDLHPNSGLDEIQTTFRRDSLQSRKRWQFTERSEKMAYLLTEGKE